MSLALYLNSYRRISGRTRFVGFGSAAELQPLYSLTTASERKAATQARIFNFQI
jgi:hypothetical protein